MAGNTNYIDCSYYVYSLRVAYERQPFYIGKGKGIRAEQHLMPFSLVKNSHKNNKIKKARASGRRIFIEYLATGLTNSKACEIEREFIAMYGRWDTSEHGNLTNRTDGGEGSAGFIPSEETRRKMSASRKGLQARLGKTNSKEHNLKISESSRGRVCSEETRAKISASNRGHSRKHSEETKAKMSASRMGKKMPPFSDEHRARLSAAAKARHQREAQQMAGA